MKNTMKFMTSNGGLISKEECVNFDDFSIKSNRSRKWERRWNKDAFRNGKV